MHLLYDRDGDQCHKFRHLRRTRVNKSWPQGNLKALTLSTRSWQRWRVLHRSSPLCSSALWRTSCSNVCTALSICYIHQKKPKVYLPKDYYQFHAILKFDHRVAPFNCSKLTLVTLNTLFFNILHAKLLSIHARGLIVESARTIAFIFVAGTHECRPHNESWNQF